MAEIKGSYCLTEAVTKAAIEAAIVKEWPWVFNLRFLKIIN